MQVPFGKEVKLMGMQSNWSYMKLRFEFLFRMKIFFSFSQNVTYFVIMSLWKELLGKKLMMLTNLHR